MTPALLPPLSVYVHFPWCVRKCPYCDFNSYTLQGALPIDRYIGRLVSDFRSQAPDTHGREVISVFLGGGTPSLFPPEAIERVLVALRACMPVARDAEVTMEANPGAVERGRFAEYRAAGITRVSLGAQSFDAGHLQALGRIHSPQETRLAAEELHAAGIENFNLDLMYALPHQDVAGALADLECALSLAPAHISHYQLTLEPGTVFAARPPPLPEDDTAAEMLTACAQRLAETGFSQYEVSAYARPGRRCRHNTNYWLFGDYLGVGAGAHGKLTDPSRRIVRTHHQRDPRRYLGALGPQPTGLEPSRPESTSLDSTRLEPRRLDPTRPEAIRLEPARVEVAAGQLPFEFMLNALRLVDGFEVHTFSGRTGLSWESVAPQAQLLCSRGLLEMSAGRVRASSLGLRFLNDVLLSFLPKNAQMTEAFGLSTVA